VLSVNPDPVVVERMLTSGGLACPECGKPLAPWARVAGRWVRDAAGRVERVRLRRGICSGEGGCGRTHVLLPRMLLGRRVDVSEVVWAALAGRGAGLTWRGVAGKAGRPAATVWGWLARFTARAEVVREAFARVEAVVAAGADLVRLAPAGGPVADAVAQVGAAVAAVRRAAGPAVFAVSAAELAAACSGGWLLGTRPLRDARLWINTSPSL
jgi:hypothetical protein